MDRSLRLQKFSVKETLYFVLLYLALLFLQQVCLFVCLFPFCFLCHSGERGVCRSVFSKRAPPVHGLRSFSFCEFWPLLGRMTYSRTRGHTAFSIFISFQLLCCDSFPGFLRIVCSLSPRCFENSYAILVHPKKMRISDEANK